MIERLIGLLVDITVFIDESGTIPHTIGEHDNFFVIALLFTDNANFLKKVYKQERLKVINKNTRLQKLLLDNKEIKGSEISETQKRPIYKALAKKCGAHFEIGIILLDLQNSNEHFRGNSSRAFNFLIKRYLATYFKGHSKFKDFDTINFVIDERNVATGAKFMLQEYLNIELNLIDKFCDQEIIVRYFNSNKFHLLQLSDFLANTYHRFYQKNNAESRDNLDILKGFLCCSSEYRFPFPYQY